MNAELISSGWSNYFARVSYKENAKEELNHVNPNGIRLVIFTRS